ncbi:MAG: hypothetical protein ABEK17_00865 [Candidatus Aenigmatarchaeota archaeon]
MNEKGFIYLFEIVIVSIILIVSIPYLIPPFEGKTDWSKAKLTLTGKDTLEVLNEEGYLEDLMQKDRKEIIGHVKNVLGEDKTSIGFNMRSGGAYKNQIRVACNCTIEERAELQSILSPVYFNGRMINFTIFSFRYDDLNDLAMDVIFIKDNGDLSTIRDGNYEDILKDKIEEGTGIVEFIDLPGPVINNNLETQKEIFGINASSQPTGTLQFRNRHNSSKMNYEMSKIFYGVGIDVFLGTDRSGLWELWGEKYPVRVNDSDSDGIYEVDVSNDTIGGYEYTDLEIGEEFKINDTSFEVEMVRRNGMIVMFDVTSGYEFHNFVTNDEAYPVDDEKSRVVLQTSTGEKPGIIVNRTGDKGRTVWISKGRGDDIRSLVKTGVIWASERGWWNVLRSVSGEKIQIRKFISQGDEVHEPYNVLMELWYLY